MSGIKLCPLERAELPLRFQSERRPSGRGSFLQVCCITDVDNLIYTRIVDRGGLCSQQIQTVCSAVNNVILNSNVFVLE